MEDKMDGWSQYLDRLLLEHHWLLLFNLPKLLKLSKLLISAFQPDFHAKKIMDELGFLFRSDVKDRKQVMGCIKVTVIAYTLHFTRMMSYLSLISFAGFIEDFTKWKM